MHSNKDEQPEPRPNIESDAARPDAGTENVQLSEITVPLATMTSCSNCFLPLFSKVIKITVFA
jgi:hypothetical protein